MSQSLDLNSAQPGTPDYYQEQYKQELADLPSNAGEAIIVIMTSLLFTVGAYEQAEEAQVGTIMQTLNDVQNEISDMQDRFNDIGQNEQQIESYQDQINSNNSTISANKSTISKNESQISSDQQELNEFPWMPPEERQELEDQISPDEDADNKLTAQDNQLTAQNTQLQSQISALQSEDLKDVDAAIDDAVEIQNQVDPLGISPDDNPFSSISSTMNTDIDTIFDGQSISTTSGIGGSRTPDYSNDSTILKAWETAWTPPSKNESDKTYNENTTLQPDTDAFNGMQTSVSGLNSSEGTELQYWQGDNQQTESLIETLMQQFTSFQTTTVGNFKPS